MLDVPKFMKRRADQMAMFFWVNALKANINTSTEKAILNFLNHNKGICDSGECLETLRSDYNRMQSEYLEMQKSNGKADR